MSQFLKPVKATDDASESLDDFSSSFVDYYNPLDEMYETNELNFKSLSPAMERCG